MDFLQPLMAVGFVLALLGGALFFLKKRVAPVSNRLQSVERLALGQHHSLHLVRVDGKSILVATAPRSVQLLGEVSQL